MVACHDAAGGCRRIRYRGRCGQTVHDRRRYSPRLKDALAKKVVLSVAWTWDSAKVGSRSCRASRMSSTVPNTPVSVGEGVIACEGFHA